MESEPLTELFTPQTLAIASDIDIPVTVHDEASTLITDAMGSLGVVNEEQTSFYGTTLQEIVNYRIIIKCTIYQ